MKRWFTGIEKGQTPVWVSVPFFIFILLNSGCAAIFGWDIHAPGMMSQDFAVQIKSIPQRIALYLPPENLSYRSANRGGKLADPQTYHVGESFAPMMVEGFQQGFEEFIFMETEPTPEIMSQYGIPYLAVVRIKDFQNRVDLKGQGVGLVTETVVMDRDLQPLAHFESRGASNAKKVFAKKGGPEVNLNAAIEHNVLAIVQYLQDSLQNGSWKGGQSA